MENLLEAWKEFVIGKKNKKDVQAFAMNFMDNIFLLHNNLLYHTYNHGGYQAFKINDPKPRDIHKALVRDRLLHHAIYRILYPFFDKIFIADSYSCRINKGTHKAVAKFCKFVYKVSNNNTRACWVLKGDIKKFFANIDHKILISLLQQYIPDKNIINLLEKIIVSFSSSQAGKGLPLGNLTSQLFVNIYMNKFDQFVKHQLKAIYYIRYSDDFVVVAENHGQLKKLITPISLFLKQQLHLELHPNKVSIRKFSQGIDFLGYVILPHYITLRTKTKKRMFKKIKINKEKLNHGFLTKESFNQSLQSYYGVLKHCHSYKLKNQLSNLINND